MTDDLAGLGKDQLIDLIRSDAFAAFKVGAFDVDGILRGKYVHRDKLLSAPRERASASATSSWAGTADQLYDNVAYTGWHTGYPDARCGLSPTPPAASRSSPTRSFLLGDFCRRGRGDLPARPAPARARARRGRGVPARHRPASSSSSSSSRRRPQLRAQKGYRDLKTDHARMFGYSVLRSSVQAELYHELLDTCADHATSRSRACTPRPAPACSRPRSPSTRRSTPPTRRRCSRPSPR